MGLLIVTALLALSSWCVVTTLRHLRRVRLPRPYCLAFAGLSVVGIATGYWLAFEFQYQLSPTLRIVSFPLPLAAFHLEHGQWVDFVTPPHVMYPGLLANALSLLALALLPLLITIRRKHIHNEPNVA